MQEQRDVATRFILFLAAREWCNILKQKADILVLDKIMTPGLDGPETYHRILKINPQQKAIIVSDFSETDRVKEAQNLGDGVYTKKPYFIAKVGLAIRGELYKNR
jgi:two-component system, cell cycle sensor histidine kinase and response regulator CckA